MDLRRLGRSGLFVPEIGLGGNPFGRFCAAAQNMSMSTTCTDRTRIIGHAGPLAPFAVPDLLQ